VSAAATPAPPPTPAGAAPGGPPDGGPAVTDPELEPLAAALRAGVGLLLRRMRQSPVSGELTLPESAALARLDRGGPTTAAALARQEQISPQSMGATLAALEARGLVARCADPDDGRRVILSLTDAGRDVRRQRTDARTRQLARALSAGFDLAELEQLKAAAPLLERLAESI
jgi:DNA-binding MarR family transcriptional regulator